MCESSVPPVECIEALSERLLADRFEWIEAVSGTDEAEGEMKSSCARNNLPNSFVVLFFALTYTIDRLSTTVLANSAGEGVKLTLTYRTFSFPLLPLSVATLPAKLPL